MAKVMKILGQLSTPYGDETPYLVYSVPVGKSAVVSTVVIACIDDASPATISLHTVLPTGSPDSLSTILYKLPIGLNDSYMATVGITLQAGASIQLASHTGGGAVTINVYGTEIG
jgi:hypothetical protein